MELDICSADRVIGGHTGMFNGASGFSRHRPQLADRDWDAVEPRHRRDAPADRITKKTAADCITYIAGPLQSDAVVMRLETVYCNYCNRLQRSQNGPTKYRRSIAVVTDELLR